MPGEEDEVVVVVDGCGEVRRVCRSVLQDLCDGVVREGVGCSVEGHVIVVCGAAGERFVILRRQVEAMILDWPHKRAAVFVERPSRV